MSYTTLISKSVEEAKKALADLVINVRVYKNSQVYNTNTGKATITQDSKYVDMAITRFQFNEVDGSNVRSDDLKGIVFDADVELESDDLVTIKGIEYKFINIVPVLSGTTIVLQEVQLRK